MTVWDGNRRASILFVLVPVRMYVCRKVKNSQARTGHQRGMGGRGTDDDDTLERHTDSARQSRAQCRAREFCCKIL